MFQVPLFRGIHGAFQADESLVPFALESGDGLILQYGVQADQGLFAAVADYPDRVVAELFASGGRAED